MNTHQSHIVCIGGGTGTFVALKGLKHYPCELSAIVTMSDSGGSNKRLRDEFGLLPTSDIRQCFVALSDENGGAGLLRKLFMYRFEKGKGISGMTFGNLFMAALSDILGSQEEAIKQTGKVLRVKGAVIPVSFTNTNLFAVYEDGHVLKEEHLIDEPSHDGTLRITDVYLKPKATANRQAITAIKNADLIVLGPGDVYTSLLPNLLVGGIADAICASHAKKVYVVNLMTKYGQTYDYKASDHLKTVEKYVGQTIDYVVINRTPLPQTALTLYEKHLERPVVDDLHTTKQQRIIREDLVGRQIVARAKSDRLVRSLIRHDSEKLALVLINLIKGV
jgi:uncharacterized cofD-like protein